MSDKITSRGRTVEVLVVADDPAEATGDQAASAYDSIKDPGRVMRMGRMATRLLDEAKAAPLDDPARLRLVAMYQQTIDELVNGVHDSLAEELRRMAASFPEDGMPTDAELRLIQAQLVGWLEGLFQGIQAALMAKHLSAEMLEQAAPITDSYSSHGGMYL